MLQVSDAYKELVKSNIRPKCEPIIRVSGKDNNGNDIELIWNAKNIKDLTYKRGIDPIGRELPYMELTWTEIYTGKLNAESYPEKYNNITKYMQVELVFVQDLGFYNTWKQVLNGGLKWKDLFATTWKQVKNGVTQQTIEMPKLFLNARPTINGQTITWVAKDLLSFANEVCSADYKFEDPDKPENIQTISANLILNARAAFLKSRSLFDAYTKVIKSLADDAQDGTYDVLYSHHIICDGATNNVIVNLASIFNKYYDFKDDIFVLKKIQPDLIQEKDVVANFNKNLLYSYPKIEALPNVSSYCYKNRVLELDKANMYSKKPDRIIEQLGDYYLVEYVFNDYVIAYDRNPETHFEPQRINIGSLKKGYAVTVYGLDADAYVIPAKYAEYDNIINNDVIGEPFIEDNPINPFGYAKFEFERPHERNKYISSYFLNSSSISFECLPNIAVETGDIITADTNLYDEQGKEIKKSAIVVSVELKYDGSIRQSIKAHEVKVNNYDN